MISFILAVKDYDHRLGFFIESYNQFSHTIHKELIIVASVENFQDFKKTYSDETITVIYQRPNGIYNAYNCGIENAKFDWLMFFGQDDIILPSLAFIFVSRNLVDYDIIVNPVVFGKDGTLYPIKNYLGLIFKNWCHQGVIYRKQVFLDRNFDQKYVIQGDHEFNIYASKVYRVNYTSLVVSYFSTDGTSQLHTDQVFKQDMHSIIRNNFGVFPMILSVIRGMIGSVMRRLNKERAT